MTQHHSDRHGFKSRVLFGESRTPHMVVWLMKNFRGFIKTERQAGIILFVFTLLVFLLAADIFWGVMGRRFAPMYRSYAPDANVQYPNDSSAR